MESTQKAASKSAVISNNIFKHIDRKGRDRENDSSDHG